MAPFDANGWLEVARERAADADALVETRQTSIACVYIVGYALECSLKALLQAQGAAFPTSGSAGHNLHALWKRSGLTLRDLRDDAGTASFFITDWSTSLRYETALAEGQVSRSLVDAAKRLTGFLHQRVRRSRRRRR